MFWNKDDASAMLQSTFNWWISHGLVDLSKAWAVAVPDGFEQSWAKEGSLLMEMMTGGFFSHQPRGALCIARTNMKAGFFTNFEQGWCFRNVAVDFQLMNQSWLSQSLKGLGRGRPGRIWTVLSEGRKLAHADDDGRLFQPPTQKSSMYSKNEHEGCIFHQIRRERRLSLAAVPPPPHDDDPSKLAVASKA